MSTRKKVVIIVAVVLVIAILALLGVKMIPYWVITSSDGYKAAYGYLINTYTFSGLDAKKSDIKFVTVDKRQAPGNPSPQERIVLEYHFTLKGDYVKIICHEYNGKVTVCRTCTQIK